MNENTELMMHIYQTAEMGCYSTKNLLGLLLKKENKIKHVLESELKEYEKYLKESKRYLEQNDVTPKSSSMISKVGSDIGMKMETMKDNSDPAMAQMLIEGFTMGIVEMTSKIEKYKKVCKKNIMDLATDFLEFQENEVEKLKTFM